MQTKHLIFGTGLIGSYLAGCFHQNKINLHLLGRKSSKVSLLNGFTLSDYERHSFDTKDQLKFIQPSSSDTFDVIWLTVKCTSIANSIEQLKYQRITRSRWL